MMVFSLGGEVCPNCGTRRFIIDRVDGTCPHCLVSPANTFPAALKEELA